MKGIRASLLPTLFTCIRSLDYLEDKVSNEYAETGSLIHCGIEALHKLKSIDSALAVMAVKQSDYPEANGAKAVHGFRRYAEEQQQWGSVSETEYPIAFTLAPSPIDPTKEEIVIEGTLDQVRVANGIETVADAKTGSKSIKWMTRHYAPQLAAYQYGWFVASGRKPHATIIRTQDALSGGGKFWHPVPWGWDTVLDIMDAVRTLVALRRLGLKIATGGDHCEWCPAGGIENCSIGAKKEKGKYALPVATSIEDLFK